MIEKYKELNEIDRALIVAIITAFLKADQEESQQEPGSPC